MRRAIIIALCLILYLALSILGSAPPPAIPSIDEVLTQVSRNVREFQDLLPDFECTERITSTAFEKNGLIAAKRVIDSTFTGKQKNDGQGHSYTESRELLAIDGVPAAKGQPVPALPFQYGGGFSSSVVSTFSPEVLDYRTYRLTGTANLGGSSTLLVEFATKKGQQILQMISRGKKFVVKDTGKAWIDPASMQVLQLAHQFTDFPNFSAFSTVVTYGETEIAGRKFWMPKAVRVDATDSETRNKVAYMAEYSQCHRYGATVELKFGE